jgi:hypothetical protein
MTLSGSLQIAVLLFVFSGTPAVIHGQTDTQTTLDCDIYDDCALRVQHNLLSSNIVRGPESTRVARIGFGTPPLENLFARSEVAAASFGLFRTDHTRASWLTVLGGVEFLAGIIAGARGNDDLAMALAIGGTVIEVVGAIFRTKANEHLSHSIWWYNQSLSEKGGR